VPTPDAVSLRRHGFPAENVALRDEPERDRR